jgi:hypothetical protein
MKSQIALRKIIRAAIQEAKVADMSYSHIAPDEPRRARPEMTAGSPVDTIKKMFSQIENPSNPLGPAISSALQNAAPEEIISLVYIAQGRSPNINRADNLERMLFDYYVETIKKLQGRGEQTAAGFSAKIG